MLRSIPFLSHAPDANQRPGPPMPFAPRRALAVAMSSLMLAPVASAQSLQRATTFPLETVTAGLGSGSAAALGARGIALVTQERQIVLIDSTGVQRRALGRGGSGPGEFSALLAVNVRRDTIFALDTRLRRVTAFAPGGKLDRTTAIVVPASVPLPFEPVLLSGGDVVLRQFAVAGHPWIGAHGSLMIRAQTAGTLVDTLGALDVRDAMGRIPLGDGAEQQFAQPYVETDRIAVSGDGRWVAVVRRPGGLFNQDTRQVLVELVSPRGRSNVRLAVDRTPLEDRTVREWLDERARGRAQIFGGEAAARRAYASQLIRPEFHPAVRGAVIGNDGTLWILQSPVGADSDRWTVVAPSGTVLGAIPLPAESRPLVVEREHAWVLHTRDDGEQQLVRYRVRW